MPKHRGEMTVKQEAFAREYIRNGGKFFDCFNKERALWHTKQVDSRTVPISNKQQIAQWADVYMVNISGSGGMRG